MQRQSISSWLQLRHYFFCLLCHSQLLEDYQWDPVVLFPSKYVHPQRSYRLYQQPWTVMTASSFCGQPEVCWAMTHWGQAVERSKQYHRWAFTFLRCLLQSVRDFQLRQFSRVEALSQSFQTRSVIGVLWGSVASHHLQSHCEVRFRNKFVNSRAGHFTAIKLYDRKIGNMSTHVSNQKFSRGNWRVLRDTLFSPWDIAQDNFVSNALILTLCLLT